MEILVTLKLREDGSDQWLDKRGLAWYHLKDRLKLIKG